MIKVVAVIAAHKRSSNHREAVSQATECGCFYCCAVFQPVEITDWTDPASDDVNEGTTALCPKCGIDSVIPLQSGMDVDFLRRMKAFWF